jgi:hypothetical protein
MCTLDLYRLLVDDERQTVPAPFTLDPEDCFSRKVIPDIE